MKCKKCGADIPMENVQFCPYCGTDFSQNNHPSPSSEVTSQKSSKSTKKEKSGKKPFYKDVLFWMLIILILPFVFWGWLGLLIAPVLFFALIYFSPLLARLFERFQKKESNNNVATEQKAYYTEKNHSQQDTPKSASPQITVPLDSLMTSQFPALYLGHNDELYYATYISRLERIGFSAEDAQKMFEFECKVIRKYNKWYLMGEHFTKIWFFDLKQPFFKEYPNSKEDILKEKFLTMSEICKLIDEAEWHFWNSHERELPDGVWEEIFEWRLGGSGAKFAMTYFEMIEKETGISHELISKLCAAQGEHLNKYRWR